MTLHERKRRLGQASSASDVWLHFDHASETLSVTVEPTATDTQRDRTPREPRARERRAHRSPKATRAGPSGDDDPPGELPASSDALVFAVAVQTHLRAFARVLESEHRDLHGITETSYDVLNREVVGLRETLAVFIEAERVAEAVELHG